MRSVAKHPEAKREIIEAAEFYEKRQTGLGDRFLDDLQFYNSPWTRSRPTRTEAFCMSTALKW